MKTMGFFIFKRLDVYSTIFSKSRFSFFFILNEYIMIKGEIKYQIVKIIRISLTSAMNVEGMNKENVKDNKSNRIKEKM